MVLNALPTGIQAICSGVSGSRTRYNINNDDNNNNDNNNNENMNQSINEEKKEDRYI